MRAFALGVADAHMSRDTLTMSDFCPHCSLKRQGDKGYGGMHDEKDAVNQVRRLGF